MYQQQPIKLTAIILSIAVTMLVLVGCGTSSSENSADGAAPQPMSVDDVASLLSKMGLGCQNLSKPAKSEWNLGTDSALGVGECSVSGDDIEFIVFSDEDAARTYLTFAKKIGCEFGKAFGISEFDIVRAGNWTAEGMGKVVAEQIAKAGGGKAEHVKC
jgi:hypothetical protein